MYQVFFEENAMSTVPKFRIDVNVHSLLMNSTQGPELPANQGLTLPEPIYPRFPEKLSDPGPKTPPEKRDWTLAQAYRSMKGWLFPYVRSRVTARRIPSDHCLSIPRI